MAPEDKLDVALRVAGDEGDRLADRTTSSCLQTLKGGLGSPSRVKGSRPGAPAPPLSAPRVPQDALVHGLRLRVRVGDNEEVDVGRRLARVAQHRAASLDKFASLASPRVSAASTAPPATTRLLMSRPSSRARPRRGSGAGGSRQSSWARRPPSTTQATSSSLNSGPSPQTRFSTVRRPLLLPCSSA